MTSSTSYIRDLHDTYEIRLHGFIIARITYHAPGLSQDVQYEDLPEHIKEKILSLVEQEIKDDSE